MVGWGNFCIPVTVLQHMSNPSNSLESAIMIENGVHGPHTNLNSYIGLKHRTDESVPFIAGMYDSLG